MDHNKNSWPPKPSELELPRTPNNSATVSVTPLGIMSCALSSLLLGAYLFFLWHLHQMSLQEKIGFIVLHNNLIGMLQGAEIVGIPVALLLGILSWRTKPGKVGLLLTGIFLLAALYIYLFGLPLSVIFNPSKPPH